MGVEKSESQMLDRLTELICSAPKLNISFGERRQGRTFQTAANLAKHLLANGVVVTPCVAMVERFIKDGKFDRKHTAHNGRYAVVYVDKSKWGCPLIDITEQFYNAEKAEAAIKERSKE